MIMTELDERLYSRTNVITPIDRIERIIDKIMLIYKSGNVEPIRLSDQEFDDLQFITGGYIYNKKMKYKIKRLRYPNYSIVFIGKFCD